MSNNKARIIGQVGCYVGHLRAIKFAIENDLGNVIILEDDCSFWHTERQLLFQNLQVAQNCFTWVDF